MKALVTKPPFSALNCFARYLAGGVSLKQSRYISRKRLFLAASGVGVEDNDALKLHHQIQQYLLSVKKLKGCTTLSIELLCEVNKRLTPQSGDAGKIRSVRNWIGGGGIEHAIYDCPIFLQLYKAADDLLKTDI